MYGRSGDYHVLARALSQLRHRKLLLGVLAPWSVLQERTRFSLIACKTTLTRRGGPLALPRDRGQLTHQVLRRLYGVG